jgi:hypothetical protein
MPELPEPSEWALRHFGEHWEATVMALLQSGVAAHERGLSAKDGSRLETNQAYGSTFWLALPQEVAKLLAVISGAMIVRFEQAQYLLAVVGDSLIFPFRFGNGSRGADQILLRPSRLRASILAMRNFPEGAVQDPLDFGPAFERPDDPKLLARTVTAIKKTISVAYDCEPGAGLRHVYIGEVAFDEKSGAITWLYREELPMLAITQQFPLAALADPEGALFDSTPVPDIDLQLRKVDRSAFAYEAEQ